MIEIFVLIPGNKAAYSEVEDMLKEFLEEKFEEYQDDFLYTIHCTERYILVDYGASIRFEKEKSDNLIND